MRKRDELTNPASCMSRAQPDEMTFVLLGRDPAAPASIRAWVERRIRLGTNAPDDDQVRDALECARTMEAEAKQPIAATCPPIKDWPIVPGYSCRACGQSARANPRDSREWGCAQCDGSSHALTLNFTRDADEGC